MSKLVFKPEEIDLGIVAEALAADVRSEIAAAPENRWNKTGTLVRSIRTESKRDGSAVVTVTGDRLNDDRVAQMFADEILPDDLDKQIRELIAEQVFGAVTVEE